MSSSNFEKIREFHSSFNLPNNFSPTLANKKSEELRLSLIEEEYNELLDALEKRDVLGVADALTDLLYVTYGMGAVYGIDLDRCYAEVHASNMTKLGENGKPIYRKDGKVLKGPIYRPPNLKKVLFGDNNASST